MRAYDVPFHVHVVDVYDEKVNFRYEFDFQLLCDGLPQGNNGWGFEYFL